eukprot:GHVR01133631.1.p1 GENE.GHVR01133631.1~~GHVR01133631.1.p1  ORF type:complete len:223 (+),score=96.47 GHVR01133631.1:82-750(+)
MESTFDIFTIGIGPSSSHTIGPMRAASAFINLYKDMLYMTTRIKIDLYGSLALTGKGHRSDYAIVIGMNGYLPETVDIQYANKLFDDCKNNHIIILNQKYKINFNYKKDILFNCDTFLPEHSNGMKFSLFNNNNGLLCEKEYFSIGGGFILDKNQIKKRLSTISLLSDNESINQIELIHTHTHTHTEGIEEPIDKLIELPCDTHTPKHTHTHTHTQKVLKNQ